MTHAAWVGDGDGWVRLVSNLNWILTLPGWATALVFYKLGIGGGKDELVSIVIANGFGWAYLVIGAFVCLKLRHVIATRRSVASDEPEQEKHADHDRPALLAQVHPKLLIAVSL